MKIIIVDEKDNILGFKERNSVLDNELYRVSSCWIVNEKNQVLLAKRSLNKKRNPGKWGPSVAGTLEEGETYESNIVKEFFEELGLEDSKPVEILKEKIIGEGENFFVHWFYLKTDKKVHEFKLQEDEVSEVKFFEREEIFSMVKRFPEKFTSNMDKYLNTLSLTF